MKRKGFTLIEIMVVMAIIAVLAVLIIGAVQLARTTATETQHRSNVKSIQTALEAQYARAKMYCGNTGGPICGAGSLEAVSTRFTPNIALNNSSTSGACAVAGVAEGGGKVLVLTGTTYRIVPASSACPVLLGGTDASDAVDVNSGSIAIW